MAGPASTENFSLTKRVGFCSKDTQCELATTNKRADLQSVFQGCVTECDLVLFASEAHYAHAHPVELRLNSDVVNLPE